MNYLAFIGVTAATAVVSCTPAKQRICVLRAVSGAFGQSHGDGVFTGGY